MMGTDRHGRQQCQSVSAKLASENRESYYYSDYMYNMLGSDNFAKPETWHYSRAEGYCHYALVKHPYRMPLQSRWRAGSKNLFNIHKETSLRANVTTNVRNVQTSNTQARDLYTPSKPSHSLMGEKGQQMNNQCSAPTIPTSKPS
jgi:hypothetical protein